MNLEHMCKKKKMLKKNLFIKEKEFLEIHV